MIDLLLLLRLVYRTSYGFRIIEMGGFTFSAMMHSLGFGRWGDTQDTALIWQKCMDLTPQIGPEILVHSNMLPDPLYDLCGPGNSNCL